MKPAYYRIEDHYKGDTFDGVEFTLLNTDDQLPIDLTGVAIKIDFKKDSPTGAVKASFNVGSGVELTDPTNGVFELSAIDKLNWDVGVYYYDVEVTFSNGVTKTYLRGLFKIIQDTTNG
jgi:hypothetical protein